MTEPQDSAIAAVLAPDEGANCAVRPAGTVAASERTTPALAGQERAQDLPPYRPAVRALLPRWSRMLGVAPWREQIRRSQSSSSDPARALLREQGSALGVGMLLELEPDRPDASYLRECVRASLIRWQLSLRGDGRPAAPISRRDPLHATVTLRVVQLLSDVTGFVTGSLLEDVARNLRWLSLRSRATPWLEAAGICALADGALLVRDIHLLKRARQRLGDLLARQHEEGWFAERGGADIGRLSLTLDALARLFVQNEWPELSDPLRRCVKFLTHFVQPDGLAGGCYGSCDTGFISPYGVELLAPTIPEAARLARICRFRFGRTSPDRILTWDDELCTLLGGGVALAAMNASASLPDETTRETDRSEYMHFPGAGLSIYKTDAYQAVVNTRKGGALRITWRGGEGTLDDPGVTVVYPHSVITSHRHDPRTRQNVSPASAASEGVLRRNRRARRGLWARLRRSLRRLTKRAGLARSTAEPTNGPKSRDSRTERSRRALLHDRFEREISFDSEGVVIRDRVRCLRSPDAVLLEPMSPGCAGSMIDGSAECQTAHLPIFVSGGRHLELTRVYRGGRLDAQHADSGSRPGPTSSSEA